MTMYKSKVSEWAVAALAAFLSMAATDSFVPYRSSAKADMVPVDLRIDKDYDNIFSVSGYDAVQMIGLNVTIRGLLMFEDGITIVPSGWRLFVLDDGTKPSGWDSGTTFIDGLQPIGILDVNGSGLYTFNISKALQGEMDETPTVDEGATYGTFLSLIGQHLSDNTFFAARFTNGDMLSQGFHQAYNEKNDILIDRTQPVPALSPPLYGDANLDGIVDASDYMIVKQNFGATGASWAMGDFDKDGYVDWDDLQMLMGNFGTRNIGTAPATTPEPATMALLWGMGAVILIPKRPRRSRKAAG